MRVSVAQAYDVTGGTRGSKGLCVSLAPLIPLLYATRDLVEEMAQYRGEPLQNILIKSNEDTAVEMCYVITLFLLLMTCKLE